MIAFLWPHLLWLEAIVPVLAAAFVGALRRRRKRAAPAALSFLPGRAAWHGPPWRVRLAPALLAVTLAMLIVATARPTATLTLPSRQQTVILALDVSGSMQAGDVAPNRITAAQASAKAFASRLPRHVRVGVVAYADSAALVQRPTARHDEVAAAIDRMQVQQGTAVGSGILTSLAAIFPGQDISLPDTSPRAHKVSTDPVAPPADTTKAVPPGSYSSAAIVLLSDGQNTFGPDPVEAAQLAANRGVKVYTVGFGTKDGEVVGFEGFSILVRLDEDTLKKVADITHAEYFHAASGADLDRVYEGLESKLVLETRDTELTWLVAAAAALLLVVAMAMAV